MRHLHLAIALPLLAGCSSAARPADSIEPGVDTIATVDGEVLDHGTARPVEGAIVHLESLRGIVWSATAEGTDRTGAFRFTDVPVGVYRVRVSADGYDAMNDSLPVADDHRSFFVLPLSKGEGSLQPRARSDDPAREGARDYEGRRRRGGAGFLITREDILEQRPRFVSEMLRRVPGGMLAPSGGGGYTLLLRGQCRPGIWMDGVRLGVRDVDNLVAPLELEAIEVYHGHQLPVEFGVDECGGILIWTRRRPPAT